MNLKLIIQDAWIVTKTNPRWIWVLAFPKSILGSIVGSLYLAYQFYSFYTSPDFLNQSLPFEKPTTIALNILDSIFNLPAGLSVFVLFILAIVVIFYLLYPVFSQSALIQLLAKQREGEDVGLVHAISFGFRRFLQLLEYQTFIKTFSFLSIISYGIFFLRNLGPDAMGFLSFFIGMFLLIGTFFSLLFTYAEYYLVLKDKGVIDSAMSSSSLVLAHWDKTLMMLVFMFLIGIRIVINILLLIGIPIVMIIAFMILVNLSGILASLIASFIGLGLWIGSAYFMAVIHVFTDAVWTFTFLELES